MAYIGNPPAERFTSFDYQDLTGGTGTSFTLTHPVGNAQEILVMVNNVVQEPGVAYTVSGTALTMTGSIVAADDFYVVYRGKAIQTATHPSDRALTATDGTFTGDLTVDTNTFHVDSTNNNVGIGTTSPSNFGGTTLQTNHGSTYSANLVSSGTHVLQMIASQTHGAMSMGARSNHHVAFTTNDTERMRILSGGGLTFNGDTAAANALDDYEEGTYSPAVSGSTVAGTGTFSSLSGAYTKIGNRVFVSLLIAHSNTHTLTGAYQITLPFTSTSNGGGGFISYKTGWVTNGPDMADIATGQALCYLRYDTNTGVGDIPGSYTQNGSTARVHIIYDAA